MIPQYLIIINKCNKTYNFKNNITCIYHFTCLFPSTFKYTTNC